jgi:hypothetical protein
MTLYDSIEACKVLEEQKMLLQSLAMKENAAKGFSGLGWDLLSHADLDNLKKDVCMILQETRNKL